MTLPPKAFVIFALPRSRTAWLSKFLSYGEFCCGHEQLRYARSLADVKAWLSMPFTGTAETAGVSHWRLLKTLRPDVKIVTVRRDPISVMASIARLPVPPFDIEKVYGLLCQQDQKLNQLERRVHDVTRVDFDSLSSEGGARVLWESVLPYQFDPAWFHLINGLNVQVNLAHFIRYYLANAEQLSVLARKAKTETISLIKGKTSADSENVIKFSSAKRTVSFREGIL